MGAATPPIRPVFAADLAELVRMRTALWPDESNHFVEARKRINGTPDSEFLARFPCAVWVAERPEGGLAGFVEIGLRSHAEGCYAGNPIGYVEGWYVDPDVRNRGIGRALMEAAEGWARARGCTEMASDAELDNRTSHRAHAAIGYDEVIRIVAFRKRL